MFSQFKPRLGEKKERELTLPCPLRLAEFVHVYIGIAIGKCAASNMLSNDEASMFALPS